MNKLKELTDKIEQYKFECEAGPLTLCSEWIELKGGVSDAVAPIGKVEELVEYLRSTFDSSNTIDEKLEAFYGQYGHPRYRTETKGGED